MISGFKIVSLLGLLLILTNYSFAGSNPKVFVKNGDIYYRLEGNTVQLTHSGKDKAPVLSPNGEMVVFIRETSKISYSSEDSGADYPNNADQLWVVGVDGKNEKMLVKNRRPNESRMKGDGITKELEDMIDEIDGDNLKFSPDGRRVYFISSAWTASGALHVVNIDGTNEHFITSANTLKRVIAKGKYRGDLVISQHRYYSHATGSYDDFYLFTPLGKEVKALGDVGNSLKSFNL